ncbi:hypothetical protein M885DRAFT_337190 [Pelagophyceae sp. CCMP2097]|nr:hypothetical protein M885DRAFT_337190 [Pelagophyceae sp. CCMP2097]
MTAMLQRLAAAKSGRGDDDERRRGAYPVHLAVRQRSAAMVELCLAALRDPFSATLVQATDDSGVSPRHYRDTPLGATLLHDAAFSRAPDALRTLLRHGGFDVDLAIEYAVGRRSGPLIESVTPLEVAANRNCVRCAEELLAAGAAVEFFQVPPVALRGHAAAAGVLLAAILASEARNLGAALPLDRKYGPGGETMCV